jgi:endonuclease/exonuclease/phosphatase family metal-dependent hydrolase
VICSRYPLISAVSTSVVLWPEPILSADVSTPTTPVRILGTHIPPGSSNGWIKVEMLEAVLTVLSEPCPRPCVLCGDFNVPQAESDVGRIVTWAERPRTAGEPRLRSRLRGGPAERWDLARVDENGC